MAGDKKRRAPSGTKPAADVRGHALLRSLYDRSFELIGLLSPEGVLLDANQTALSMIGARLEDMLGRYFWDTPWWDENEKPRLRDAVRRAASGEFVRYRTMHQDLEGRVHTIDFSLKPILDDRGEVAYLIPEGRDMTEQADLETDRARLASIVESSGDAIISKSLDGVIQSWNKGAEIIYGYTPSEVINRHVSMLIPAERREEHALEIGKIAAGVPVVQFETVRVCKDGRRVDVAVTLSPIRDGSGRVMGVSSVAKDITASIESARALKHGHRMLEAISKAQSEFIAGVKPRALFEGLLDNLLKLTASEYGFIGEVFHDESGAPYLKAHAITNIAWNEETRSFYDNNAPKGLEFHNLKTLFGAVLVTGSPVVANDPANDPRRGGLPEGHPALRAFLGLPFFAGKRMIGMVGLANRPGGYAQDIVDSLELLMGTCANIIEAYRIDMMRQQAERDLHVSETRLRAILDSAVDGVVTADENAIIQSFNPAAERIFGYAAHEVIGRNLKMLMPEPYCVEHDTYIHNYLTTGKAKIIGIGREVAGKRKDGSIFPLELSVSEVRLEEGRLFTGIVRDITERRKVERLKREFVSTVSHELRTPLTSIHGALGLLLGGVAGQLVPKAESLLSIARNNTSRLIKLINDILDMEKLESEKMSFNAEPVDMREVISTSLSDTQALAGERGVVYAFDQSGPGAIVLGDRDRLVQVMTNLLSNAVKFSPDGGRVDIRLDVSKTRVSVVVSDQGPGIPKEFQARVFEKFAQADGSDSRRKGGTGLGLSISKGIVEMLGGEISFSSPPEGGAAFRFSFPVHDGPNAIVRRSGAAAPGQLKESSGKAAILHVDDDQDILDVVSLVLKDIGETVSAKNLEQALGLLKERSFDLVVLDVILPDGSGLDLLPELDGVPVLVFSVKELPVDVAGTVGSVLLKSRAGNDKLLSEAKRLLGLGA